MLRTHKYLHLNLNGLVYFLILIVAALALAVVLVSIIFLVFIILWSNPEELTMALVSSEALFAIKLSLITALASTTIALLLAIPVAYSLSRSSFKGKTIIEAFLTLPSAMPPIALGAALLVFFANTVVGKAVNAVINMVFELPGIVVAQFAVVFPHDG
ncbi:MAG: hypothetical protein DRN04_13210 [Thermoprotei archaeon]|nr:MAG: hypothetical protein DRN04_13210 [Thermoprotei archaeon]